MLLERCEAVARASGAGPIGIEDSCFPLHVHSPFPFVTHDTLATTSQRQNRLTLFVFGFFFLGLLGLLFVSFFLDVLFLGLLVLFFLGLVTTLDKE